MKQKILNTGLAILTITAIIAVIHVANVNEVIREENNQLQQQNAELQLDYYKMQIQRDEAIDAVWQLNNQMERMEGEDDN